MKNFTILFLLLFSLVSSPSFADEKPEWFLCKADSDCVSVGGCKIIVVNKAYAKEAQSYYDQQDANNSCHRPRTKGDIYQYNCTHRKESCKDNNLKSGCETVASFCGMSVKQDAGK